MIAATVEELTPLIGTRPACRALGASRSSAGGWRPDRARGGWQLHATFPLIR